MRNQIILGLLISLFAVNVTAEPVEYPTNKDGSTITGVLTAAFDPLNLEGQGNIVPFPFNLAFLDLDTFGPTQDYTLVIPNIDDPEDFGDPSVALSAMDGFSTTEKWVTSFVDYPDGQGDIRSPGNIDPASVVPGHSVRVFQVDISQFLFVTGVVRELVAGVDFVATVIPGGNIAIIPRKPLQELTGYMAVLTNDIRDTDGNNATADTTYFSLQRTTPWVDENGNSTYSLVPDDFAQTLERVRPLVNSWEAAAESAGVVREDIILSWVVQTQSTTAVLKHVRSIAKPAATVVGKTGLNTAPLGGAGIADIYAGIITMPYYLGVPASNPFAPLTDFWKAAPGAYVPPFDEALPVTDTTSTHITYANPFPVLTDKQTVPLLMSVPNQASGHTKPAAGWPTVIFGHTMGGNRSQMLALADTAALAGYAVIAIDFPLHGITPEAPPPLSMLYIGNTPFAPIANERTFDVDYIDNSTGAPGADEITDPSGTHFFNPSSLLTNRDNFRQGIVDLSTLAVSIPSIDINGDSLPDLDGSNIVYAGVSLGGILGTTFTAIEPMVSRAFLSAPVGGVLRAFEASPTFGPRIRAGLAAKDVLPGTSDYEGFFNVAQTVFESADPINWGAEASRYNSVVLHEVMGDTVFPNYVTTAPLSGTEPLIATMDLTAYSSTQLAPAGVKVAGRFLQPAEHGSFLDPSASQATTVEMQKQFASFIATLGTTVVVEDAATMVPAVSMQVQSSSELKELSNSRKVKSVKAIKSPTHIEKTNKIQFRKTSKPSEQQRSGEQR